MLSNELERYVLTSMAEKQELYVEYYGTLVLLHQFDLAAHLAAFFKQLDSINGYPERQYLLNRTNHSNWAYLTGIQWSSETMQNTDSVHA